MSPSPGALSPGASSAPNVSGTPFGVASPAANAVGVGSSGSPAGVARIPSALSLASPNAASSGVPPSTGTQSTGGAQPDASAAPQFVKVALLPQVVHSGDTVRWDVKTSSSVVAVSASVKAYHFTLQREAPGHFGLAFAIPAGVPWFFHGDYKLDLTASDAAGRVASTSAVIVFR